MAILGSYVSRCIFNKQFIPNYKHYFQLLSYAHQPSLISIMSKPIPYYYKNMVGKSKSVLDRDHFRQELEKQFLLTLANEQPDILVMDFYAEVMYGVVQVNDESYMVDKDFRFKHYRAYKKLKIGKKFYPRENFDEFFELWKEKINEFNEWARINIPNTKIIVNKARAKKTFLDENDNEVVRPEKRDLDEINRLWDTLDQYAINTFGYEGIDYSNDEYYLQEDHVFGNYFVHFDQKYYNLFFSKLKNIADHLGDKKNKFIPAQLQNLVLNSNLEYGNKFWTKWSKDVIVGLKDNRRVLVLDEFGHKDKAKTQVWSALFEINADGNTEYEMNFTVSFHDVDADGKFFCIRTFNKKDLTSYADSKRSYDFYLKDYSTKKADKVNVVLKFKPKGKYIKFAPFINKNGHIEYFDFKLKKVI